MKLKAYRISFKDSEYDFVSKIVVAETISSAIEKWKSIYSDENMLELDDIEKMEGEIVQEFPWHKTLAGDDTVLFEKQFEDFEYIMLLSYYKDGETVDEKKFIVAINSFSDLIDIFNKELKEYDPECFTRIEHI